MARFFKKKDDDKKEARRRSVPESVASSAASPREKVVEIDYKDVDVPKNTSRKTPDHAGSPDRHPGADYQRQLAPPSKRARFLALLPYTDNHQ